MPTGPRYAVKLAAVATLCLMAQPLVGTADASDIGCGSLITSDTKLTHNITCTGNGLIFGADNITLDLGGFVLAGPGPTVRSKGVHTSGHSGVVVTNGIVKSFSTGVWVGGPDSALEAGGSGNTVRGVTTKNNGVNVYLHGTADTGVTHSKMLGGGRYGLKIIRGRSISVLNNKIYNTAGHGIWNDFGGWSSHPGKPDHLQQGQWDHEHPEPHHSREHDLAQRSKWHLPVPARADGPLSHEHSRNLICDNAGNGISMTAEGHTITDNDVGAGTEECLANGRSWGFDLYDGAAAELPFSDIVCTSTWRNNYTEGDTFNHPCVTK